MNNEKNPPRGIAFAFSAYSIWGLLPLYWHAVAAVDPLQILACRIVFSLLFVWLLLAARGKIDFPKILADKRTRRALLASSALIGVNWGLYIWAVNSGHTVDASLGYFINPIVNVLLGTVFFRERLKTIQWIAFGFTAAGVVLLTVMTGVVPWIALALALSFGLYGYAKKAASTDALTGLGAETLLLAPLALLFLIFKQWRGEGAFSGPPIRDLLLVLSGIVTALPLYWFARGAKMLPLSLMGFIQFMSPTLQLIIGVAVFGEAFPASRLWAFILVWTGLLVYSLSFVLGRGRKAASKTA